MTEVIPIAEVLKDLKTNTVYQNGEKDFFILNETEQKLTRTTVKTLSFHVFQKIEGENNAVEIIDAGSHIISSENRKKGEEEIKNVLQTYNMNAASQENTSYVKHKLREIVKDYNQDSPPQEIPSYATLKLLNPELGHQSLSNKVKGLNENTVNGELRGHRSQNVSVKENSSARNSASSNNHEEKIEFNNMLVWLGAVVTGGLAVVSINNLMKKEKKSEEQAPSSWTDKILPAAAIVGALTFTGIAVATGGSNGQRR